jgi:ketosteroid isomerase-like protein
VAGDDFFVIISENKTLISLPNSIEPMRKLLLLWLLTALFGLDLSAQEALKAKDQKAILEVLQVQQEAWNRADIPAFMEGYWRSDSLTFMGSDGPNYGWQTTLDNYQKRYPDQAAMGKLEFGVLRLEKLGPKSAFMIGRFHLTREIGDLSGYFTLVWKKIGGQWLIVSDHTS